MSDSRSISHYEKGYDSDSLNSGDRRKSYITETFSELDGNYNKRESSLVCQLCKNQKYENEQFIVTSCNHIFHNRCLAELQFEDANLSHVIDADYCRSRKCPVCQSNLCIEELLFLHTKYLSNTKVLIGNHQRSIEQLEAEMQKIKEELNVSYKYKGKLENQRDRSKIIVSNITTLL
jgi:hypothetical protein